MVSRPIIQKITVAHSAQATGEKCPVTAIQPPAAAAPSVTPSQTWHSQVKRLVYGYPIRKSSASGSSATHSGLSCHAANSSTATLTATSPQACAGLTLPLGTSRPAVRGLRASIARSMTRLAAIAAVRAAAIATVTQIRVCQPGQPVPFWAMLASSIPA